MPNEPFNDEWKDLWQSQSTEKITMSSEQFRQRAEKLRTRAFWMAIANDAVCLALLVYLGYMYTRLPNSISRLGIVLLGSGSVYVFLRGHKRWWPAARVPGAPPESGAAAYRRELVRRRDASRDIWKSLLPVIPGCLVFAVPPVLAISHSPLLLKNALPFFGVLAVWLMLAIPVRRRKLQKLQGEIDSLPRLP